MICRDCPLRASCTEICPDIERQLPREDQGRIEGATKGGSRYLKRLEDRRSETRHALEHRHELTGRMREVFDLRFNDARSHNEIARALGIQRRVVTTYLARAFALIGKLASGLRKRQRG